MNHYLLQVLRRPGLGLPCIQYQGYSIIYRVFLLNTLILFLSLVSFPQNKMTEGFESHVPKKSRSSAPFRLTGSNNATISTKYARSGSRSLKSEIPLSPTVSNPRSEIQHKGWTGSPNFVQPEHKFFTTRSFGFSFYFPNDFDDFDPLDESLMQWKNVATDDCNIGFPGFSIRMKEDYIIYNIKYGSSACYGQPKTKVGRIVNKVKKGVWHNFVVEIHNDYREKGGNGYVKIWYNEGGNVSKSGDLVLNYKGPVGYKGDEGPFLKLGFYKSLWTKSENRALSRAAGVSSREMYIDDVFITEGSFGGSPTPPKNDPPKASAGNDITIKLPVNSVTIDGKATSSVGIDSYAWEKVSGPNSTIRKKNQAKLIAEDLEQGSYVFRLTVTDKNGNKDSDDVKVTVQPGDDPPKASAGKDITIKLPVNSVTIDGKATSSVGIDSYAWEKVSGPNSTVRKKNQAKLIAEDLEQGSYVFRLTVTDKNGKKDSDDVKITVLPGDDPPKASAGKDITIKLPVNSVTIDGKATSSVGIDSYAWEKVSGPNSTVRKKNQAKLIAEDLEQGNYVFRLTVTDTNGKTDSDDVKITVEPGDDPPKASAGKDITIKLPVNSVTIDGKATSSVGIDSYAWEKVSGPNSTVRKKNQAKLIAEDLEQGNYVFRLTVTDTNGKTDSDDVKITVEPGDDPPKASAGNDITITLPINSVTIDGKATSSVGIESYAWEKVSGPNSTVRKKNQAKLIAEDLEEGSYVFRLTVTDTNGKKDSDDVEVMVLAAAVSQARPSISADIEDANCNSNNGSIALNITGGNAPFRVEWAHGATGEKLTGVASGQYEAEITDNIGDVYTQKFTVGSVEANLQITSDIRDAVCNSNDGAINVEVTGGTEPYSFNWSTNGRTASLNQLSAGTYTVEVSDQNGCSKKFSFEVGVTAGEVSHDVVSTITNTSCAGDDGSISLEVNGNNGPYNFEWAHGATGASLNALANGEYQVTITDKHGCFMESVYTIDQDPEPESPQIVQSGDSLYVEQSASGYQWYKDDIAITDGSSSVLKITTSGIYHVEIINQNSCTVSSNYFTARDPFFAANINQTFTFQQVEFYPNPVIDNINVRIKLGKSTAANITIFDFQGRVMMTKDLGVVNSQIVESLPVASYPSGAYLIRATAGQEMVTSRFIIP